MARCITPICIKNPKTGKYGDVPCNRCWPCLQRRADAWAVRIMEERKRATTAEFVTLTYDDAHVPIDPETMNLTLDKKAIPAYIKRLRKLHEKITFEGKQPIKYYAVGEYGDDLDRPHYHLILFNALKDFIPLAWSLDKTMFGMVHIGDKGVTAGGARYLAQYLMTGQDEPYEIIDGEKKYFRQRPFSLMSKNLGSNYITKAMIKWHLQPTGKTTNSEGKEIATRNRYYIIQDGYKIAMPRYYRDKIFPKIYREIDVPLITEKAEMDEYKKQPDQSKAYHNKLGQVETNKSAYRKKVQAKNRNKIQTNTN